MKCFREWLVAELRDVGRQPDEVQRLAVPGVREPADGAGGGGRAPGLLARRAQARAAAQVQLLLAQQRAQRLVPVRGAQVRQLPHAGDVLCAHYSLASRFVISLPSVHIVLKRVVRSCVGFIEVVQSDPSDADGEAGVPQQVRAVRVRGGRAHIGGHGHVHVRQPRR